MKRKSSIVWLENRSLVGDILTQQVIFFLILYRKTNKLLNGTNVKVKHLRKIKKNTKFAEIVGGDRLNEATL